MGVYVGQPPDHLNHQPHHPGKTIKVILYPFSFFHNYILLGIRGAKGAPLPRLCFAQLREVELHISPPN